jgi:hypothetical protein
MHPPYRLQPFCRRAVLHGFDFIFVCKPDSHTTLYNWVHLLQRPELGTVTARIKVGAHFHTYAYRYANGVRVPSADMRKPEICLPPGVSQWLGPPGRRI